MSTLEEIKGLLEEMSVQSDSSSNDMIILGDDFYLLANELNDKFKKQVKEALERAAEKAQNRYAV